MNETAEIESLYLRTKKILAAQQRSATIALWMMYAALGVISFMLGMFLRIEEII